MPSLNPSGSICSANTKRSARNWKAITERMTTMPTIDQYETRIARDEAQIRFYRQMARDAVKPEHRASYAASAEALEQLTDRHKAKLAALRGDNAGQMPLFGEAAA